MMMLRIVLPRMLVLFLLNQKKILVNLQKQDIVPCQNQSLVHQPDRQQRQS